MGNKLEELGRLDRLIKDGEIRIRTIELNITNLTVEIDKLTELEYVLIENIKCLKSKNTIAIASEYKKSIEDLKKTRTRTISLMNDREHFRKNNDEVVKTIQKAKDAIEKLEKIMFYKENLGERIVDKDDLVKRIREEEDYIRCPKCNNSLEKFVAKNSDGVEDNQIARLLMMSEEKVQEVYEEAVAKLREEMVDRDEH